jgi:hypothetical protein
LCSAIEAGFAQRLAHMGLPLSLGQSASLAYLVRQSIELPSHCSASVLGEQIARALYAGLQSITPRENQMTG